MFEGSPTLAIVTALALVGGLILERLLLRWRWMPYFVAGFPLLPPLVPIPRAPEGQGRTATVRWEVQGDLVRFWADPQERNAPSGLHGAIRLYRVPGGRVGLAARWSPPWSYLLAAAWLLVLGHLRDQLALTAPIALALTVGIVIAYRHFAIRAVRELRWAFVQERPEEPPDAEA